MCRAVHVRLTADEQKNVARWTGILLPVYASIALFVLAALVFTHPPRTGEMFAAAADAKVSDSGSGGR